MMTSKESHIGNGGSSKWKLYNIRALTPTWPMQLWCLSVKTNRWTNKCEFIANVNI